MSRTAITVSLMAVLFSATASSAELSSNEMPVRVAPTVHVQLRAGESTTLFLPVPESLRARDSVAFLLHRTEPDAIGGSGAGVFMSGNATVPVTVRVPARLTGGVHRLGDVRFWSADGRGERILIPIDLRILADTMALLRANVDMRSREFGRKDGDMVPANSSLATAMNTRLAAAVSVNAAPRTVELVRVTPPSSLGAGAGAGEPLNFVVTRVPGVAVSGALSGRIDGANATVLLSVSVPSNAMAGRMRAAEVRFFRQPSGGDDHDNEQVVVPVDVVVEPIHAITVVTSSPMTHAVQGKRTTVRLIVSNEGNVEDTIQLATSFPGSWRGGIADHRPVVLAPGGSVARDVELTAPRDQIGTGNITVGAYRTTGNASSPDEMAATLVVPVEVLSSQRAAAFGPILGVSYNAVRMPGSALLDSWAFSLSGPVTDSVTMNAYWTQRALFGVPGLSRVGGGQLFPSLSLTHPRWRLDAGDASTDLGDLAGMVRTGRGLSAMYQNADWQATALISTPFAFDVDLLPSGQSTLRTRYAGVLAGASLMTVRRGTEWSATASRLRDPLLMRAQLDAFSLSAERQDDRDITARGSLAWRQLRNDAGIGALAELGRRRDDRDWRIRAAYTPGGSRAFARAQSDVTMTGSQQLGAARIGFMGYYAADSDDGEPFIATNGNELAAGRLPSRQQTRGVALLPQWRIGRSGSIGLEARVGESSSGDVNARLSTLTQVLGLFTSMRVAGISASTSASYVLADRTVEFGELPASTLSDEQLTVTGQLLWPTMHGVFDVYSSMQRRTGAGALSDGQADIVARAERVALPLLGERVHFNAAVGRSRSMASGRTVTTQRIGLSSLLPLSTYLRLDFERNPFLGVGSEGDWSTALRIERSFGTPSFMRGGRGTGVVFEDRNNNGVRDNDEPGLSGVLVRVGGEVVVTDRGGAYQLRQTGGGIPEIDERSLPFGLMVAPQFTAAAVGATGARRDIAVVPVATLDVRLELVTDSVTQNLSTSLAGVTVSARDATGRRHFARVLPDGRALFDALPSGEYQLEVDGSAAAEPLVLQNTPPRITLNGGRVPQVVRLLLGPRRVRMFRGTQSTRAAGSSASTGAR